MTNHTSGNDKDCGHVNKEYKGECFTCNAIADDISPEARKNLKAYVDKFAESEPPINTIEGYRDYWRENLSGGLLDELFEEAKTCGHEGSCWDLVNMLADILDPLTERLIQDAREELLNELQDFKDEVIESRVVGRATYIGKNELQKFIDDRIKEITK